MTSLTETLIVSITLLGALTFLIFWTLEHGKNNAIKTGALIIYGFCFILMISLIFIEVIKASF